MAKEKDQEIRRVNKENMDLREQLNFVMQLKLSDNENPKKQKF
jgi:hypothetical protein